LSPPSPWRAAPVVQMDKFCPFGQKGSPDASWRKAACDRRQESADVT